MAKSCFTTGFHILYDLKLDFLQLFHFIILLCAQYLIVMKNIIYVWKNESV